MYARFAPDGRRPPLLCLLLTLVVRPYLSSTPQGREHVRRLAAFQLHGVSCLLGSFRDATAASDGSLALASFNAPATDLRVYRSHHWSAPSGCNPVTRKPYRFAGYPASSRGQPYAARGSKPPVVGMCLTAAYSVVNEPERKTSSLSLSPLRGRKRSHNFKIFLIFSVASSTLYWTARAVHPSDRAISG